jgi:Ca2+-binding RTX toxin-like protein
MHEHISAGARRLGLATGAAALVAFGLASVSPAGAATSASVADDTHTIKGSAAGERLALRLAPGASGTLQVEFGDDGTADASFDRAGSSQIRVTLRSGDDAVDGNRGDDLAELGSGRDSFRWDPGDGSGTIDGRSGHDTLDFNGAGAPENMSPSADGRRSLFLRDVANIRMDMDNVESLDPRAAVTAPATPWWSTGPRQRTRSTRPRAASASRSAASRPPPASGAASPPTCSW